MRFKSPLWKGLIGGSAADFDGNKNKLKLALNSLTEEIS